MSVDLGTVDVLGADAVGEPGQRRFRLFLQSLHGSAILWMEKEELYNLSLALDQYLSLLSEGQILRTEARAGRERETFAMPAAFPRVPTYDFRVGAMKLSFDESNALFNVSITPMDIVQGEGLTPQFIMREEDVLSFLFTQQKARQLARSITVIVSAGRPVCPLCHAPLDGGPHACVKQNGHREIVRIEEREDEEE